MPWPLTVALALVGAVVVVLALPVRFTVIVRGGDERPVSVRVQALLGLVARPLAAAPSRAEAEAEAKPRRRPGSLRTVRRVRAFLGARGLPRRLVRYLERLWGALHVGELVGLARIGLDDPADTGELWAVMGPVSAVLARRYPDFELTPSFAGGALDLDLRWSATIVPVELLAVTARFFLSPTTLRAAAAAWRTR